MARFIVMEFEGVFLMDTAATFPGRKFASATEAIRAMEADFLQVDTSGSTYTLHSTHVDESVEVYSAPAREKILVTQDDGEVSEIIDINMEALTLVGYVQIKDGNGNPRPLLKGSVSDTRRSFFAIDNVTGDLVCGELRSESAIDAACMASFDNGLDEFEHHYLDGNEKPASWRLGYRMFSADHLPASLRSTIRTAEQVKKICQFSVFVARTRAD